PPPASGTAAPADPSDGPAGEPTDPVSVPVSPSAPSPSASGLEEVEAETSPILLAVLEATAAISPEEPSDVVGALSEVASRAVLIEVLARRGACSAERATRTGGYALGEVAVRQLAAAGDGVVAPAGLFGDFAALVAQRAAGHLGAASPEPAGA